LLLVLLACMAAFGCRSIQDPQLVYDRVSNKIVHGDLQSASIEVDRAFQRYNARSTEWGWRFKILKAQILVTQSRGQDALAVLEGVLPASLASSDVAVRQLLFQGIAYRIKQDFPNADKKLAQAEQLAISAQPALLSEVLNARGILDFDQQNYSSAEAAFHRALTSARHYNLARQQLSALGNLVRVTIINGRYGEAIDDSQTALQLARSADLRSIEAALLGNLGWCYFQLGDFENALDYFKQARDASERLGITGGSFYWEGSVAQSYQELHDYASAKELLKRTLDNASKIDNKQTMTENLNYLVRLDLITDQLEEAEQYNKQAMLIEDAGLDHFNVLETRLLAGRIATLMGDFAVSNQLFRQVMDGPAKADALKWEADAGLARMFDAQASYAPADREYRRSIEMFEAARVDIEQDDLRISFLARGIESYDAYVDFLLRHGRPLDALKVADQSRSRTLAEGLKTSRNSAVPYSRALDPRKLSQSLRATLLFYWLGEHRSYLWVVTPARVAYFALPSAQQIALVVKSYREALLGTRDPLEGGNVDGRKLYEMLIEPAKKLIPQGSRVILFPDGSLYGLNFETLVVPGPKPHYWIEDVTVTTASSLTLLASAAARPVPKEKSLFLVGNTVSPNVDFPPLPQAAVEMRDIEKYFPQQRSEVLSGSEATPSAYLSSKPEQYAYLHFVTHGTASRARPLESAVILSKGKDEDTYKLYARDIVKHHLSAYLVTISACNGAGTRAFSGEGLVGLSWAFLRAGAHNVVGALWEVSDASTPQLMDKLYDGLSHGEDPASALRAAKLSLLHSDSVFKKPYYWAPFQLYAGS
jgi:CHAT domain-containing protein/Flp pilus assembly protein TadD